MKQKLTSIITVLAVAAMIMMVTAMKIHHDGVSEVYSRYSDRADLSTSFVKGYCVGDSLTVDVTVIKAKSQEDWESLLAEMNVDTNIVSFFESADKSGNNIMTYYYCEKGHPEKHTVYGNPDIQFVVCTPCGNYFLVFEPMGFSTNRKIIDHIYDKILHKPKSQAA